MYNSNMYGKEDGDCGPPGGGQMQMQMQPHMQQPGGYMPVHQAPPHFAYSQGSPLPYSTAPMGVDVTQPPPQPFDRFPLVCSVIAMFCCPITCICSLPALICSLCGYSDYRVHDMHEFRRKIDSSRRLVIAACVFALIIWILLAFLAFWKYQVIIALFNKMVNAFYQQQRNNEGGSK